VQEKETKRYFTAAAIFLRLCYKLSVSYLCRLPEVVNILHKTCINTRRDIYGSDK
jgi:hypothetical protein